MPARYAVFGNPVSHSKSPQIHQMFAAQEGAEIRYERILADNSPTAFQAALDAFFGGGGSGANITLPFKELAVKAVGKLTGRARAAGAVNTLAADGSGLLGDNTDGAGLVQDLTGNLGISLSGCRILLLGAGGAARGVILPLLERQPESLTIANRTHSKALALADRFGTAALPFAELGGGRFDLVVNATSGSVGGSVPNIPPDTFSGCHTAYDMFYTDGDTAFMRFAAQHGARRTADGLGMLVCQAAESYRLWRGFTPDTRPVVAALRKEVRR